MSLELQADFGLSLLREQNLTGPLVFSPLSIALALSLLHVGARGRTREQIGKVIGKPEFYATVVDSLTSETVKTHSANRLFAHKNYPIQPDYKELINRTFKADAINLDFNQPQLTSEAVNEFVRETTNGKIDRIVNKDSFSSGAVAILVNALYFEGAWLRKFQSYEKTTIDFFRSAEDRREIEFLRSTSYQASYSEDSDWQVLGLSYQDPSYSLNIFLPKERFGLKAALKELRAPKFLSLIGSRSEQKVALKLPKFVLNTELDLKTSLTNLGVTDVFSDADLTGIGPNLRVSGIVHKAIIEVTENGTTAAAATAVDLVYKSMSFEAPVDFIADHPFFFALLKGQNPLFLGVFQ